MKVVLFIMFLLFVLPVYGEDVFIHYGSGPSGEEATGPGDGTPGSSLTYSPALWADDTGRQLMSPNYSQPNTTGLINQFLILDVMGNLNWQYLSDIGGVSGPASSNDNNIATFDGVTGKIIKDSGVRIEDVAQALERTEFRVPRWDSNGNLIDSPFLTDNLGNGAIDATFLVGYDSASSGQLRFYNTLSTQYVSFLVNTLNETYNLSLPADSTPDAGDYVLKVSGSTGNLFMEWESMPSPIGDVVGPASAGSGNLVTFNGTTGKVINDSGFPISLLSKVVFTETPLSTTGNIPQYNANDGREIVDSGIPITMIDDKMEWRGSWTPIEYHRNEVVIDGVWTMIANKSTFDRAGPTESGPSTWSLPDNPIWATQSETAIVQTGHLYTFNQTGWLKEVRVWVSDNSSATTQYRITLIAGSDPDNPVADIIDKPILIGGQWNTIRLGSAIVTPDVGLIVLVDQFNDGGDINVSGGWDYEGISNADGPGCPGAWNRRNQHDTVRICEVDLDSNNRQSELMGAIPGSILRFTQTNDTSRYYEYRVEQNPIDLGAYINYSVSLIDTGNGGPGILETTTMDLDIPIPQPTNYPDILSYWPANQPSWGTVTGHKEYDGVEQPNQESTAFGIDVRFQPGQVSPDWNIVSTVGTSSSGGGGGSGGGGDFYGPNVSTTDNIITFLDGTGKVGKDSGVSISSLSTMPFDFVDFTNNLGQSPAYEEGRVFYDPGDNTLNYYNDVSDMTVNIGEEMVVKVRNNSGATITNGQAVKLTGAVGQRPTIGLADCAVNTSAFGVATHDIENNTDGYVTTEGNVRDVDLSAFQEGDVLWCNKNDPGGYTATQPTPPDNQVYVGVVVNNHPTNGTIHVRIGRVEGDVFKPDSSIINGVALFDVTNGEILKSTDYTLPPIKDVDGKYLQLVNGNLEWVGTPAVFIDTTYDAESGSTLIPPASGKFVSNASFNCNTTSAVWVNDVDKGSTNLKSQWNTLTVGDIFNLDLVGNGNTCELQINAPPVIQSGYTQFEVDYVSGDLLVDGQLNYHVHSNVPKTGPGNVSEPTGSVTQFNFPYFSTVDGQTILDSGFNSDSFGNVKVTGPTNENYFAKWDSVTNTLKPGSAIWSTEGGGDPENLFGVKELTKTQGVSFVQFGVTPDGLTNALYLRGPTLSMGSNVILHLPSDPPGDNTALTHSTGGELIWSASAPGGGEGDVVGPASAVDSNLAAFDTTTGKLIKDSGIALTDVSTVASIDDLTDVDITTNPVQEDDILIWKTDKFVPEAKPLGDVVGPASSSDSYIAVFDGTTGKLLKDSGVDIQSMGNVSSVADSGVALNIPMFSDSSGKLLTDGPITLRTSIVQGDEGDITFDDIHLVADAITFDGGKIQNTGILRWHFDEIPDGNIESNVYFGVASAAFDTYGYRLPPIPPNINETLVTNSENENEFMGIEKISSQTEPVGMIRSQHKDADFDSEVWLLANGDPVPVGTEYDELRSLLDGNDPPYTSIYSLIRSPTPELGGAFGSSIDYLPGANGWLAIGAINEGTGGKVHTYKRNAGNNGWDFNSTITASGSFAGQGFGGGISFTWDEQGNPVLMIGAPFRDGNKGYVEIWSYIGSTWQLQGSDAAFNPGNYAGWNTSVLNDNGALSVPMGSNVGSGDTYGIQSPPAWRYVTRYSGALNDQCQIYEIMKTTSYDIYDIVFGCPGNNLIRYYDRGQTNSFVFFQGDGTQFGAVLGVKEPKTHVRGEQREYIAGPLQKGTVEWQNITAHNTSSDVTGINNLITTKAQPNRYVLTYNNNWLAISDPYTNTMGNANEGTVAIYQATTPGDSSSWIFKGYINNNAWGSEDRRFGIWIRLYESSNFLLVGTSDVGTEDLSGGTPQDGEGAIYVYDLAAVADSLPSAPPTPETANLPNIPALAMDFNYYVKGKKVTDPVYVPPVAPGPTPTNVIASPTPEAGGNFGCFIDNLGDTMAISACDEGTIGKVHVFKYNVDKWEHFQSISMNTPTNTTSGGFGKSLELFNGADGKTVLAIGHPYWKTGSNVYGRTEIWEADPGGAFSYSFGNNGSSVSSGRHSIAIGGGDNTVCNGRPQESSRGYIGCMNKSGSTWTYRGRTENGFVPTSSRCGQNLVNATLGTTDYFVAGCPPTSSAVRIDASATSLNTSRSTLTSTNHGLWSGDFKPNATSASSWGFMGPRIVASSNNARMFASATAAGTDIPSVAETLTTIYDADSTVPAAFSTSWGVVGDWNRNGGQTGSGGIIVYKYAGSWPNFIYSGIFTPPTPIANANWGIAVDLWDTDRNIIFVGSKNYEDVVTDGSGVVTFWDLNDEFPAALRQTTNNGPWPKNKERKEPKETGESTD